MHADSGRIRYVRLGAHSSNKGGVTQPYDAQIIEHIIHPDYTSAFNGNDIALLKLDQNVAFTSAMRPACLAQHYLPNAEMATATGWGRLEYNGPSSQTLMKVKLEIFAQDECQRQLQSVNIIDSQICAGSHSQNRDTCNVSVMPF